MQVFQLIYGGSRFELQDRQCLVALKHLLDDNFIDQQAFDELKDAYLFLRRVEHSIQALEDKQTQSLPQDEQLRERLIFALNFADWDSFQTVLKQKRSRVSYYFDALIQERINAIDTPTVSGELQELQPYLDESSYQRIEAFWQSNGVQRLPSTALKRLKDFWPYLVQAVI